MAVFVGGWGLLLFALCFWPLGWGWFSAPRPAAKSRLLPHFAGPFVLNATPERVLMAFPFKQKDRNSRCGEILTAFDAGKAASTDPSARLLLVGFQH